MAMSALEGPAGLRSWAKTKILPLIPIRRWMRHTDGSMSSRDNAARCARTCCYTLSTSITFKSNRNAVVVGHRSGHDMSVPIRAASCCEGPIAMRNGFSVASPAGP